MANDSAGRACALGSCGVALARRQGNMAHFLFCEGHRHEGHQLPACYPAVDPKRARVDCAGCGAIFEKDRKHLKLAEAPTCSRRCRTDVGWMNTKCGKWRTCGYMDCEETFYVKLSSPQKYCSQACYGLAQTTKFQKACERDGCEETFWVHPCNATDRRWCSDTCAGRQPKQQYICTQCKRVFLGRPNGSTNRFCTDEHWRTWHSDNATGWIDEDGYHNVLHEGRRVGLHRLVMEQVLGRPLAPGSTVHHKNKDRSDNRPENLEYWVGNHGPGARLDDVVADLIAEIERYDPVRAREVRALYARDDPPEDPAA